MSVRHTRAPLAAAAAVAIGLLVAACGSDASSDEVTATSLAETTTSQAAESSTETSAAETAPTESTVPGAETPADTGDAAAPEGEQAAPAPAPADQPEPAAEGDRGQNFVNGLRERGIEVSGDGDLAISTANYVCTAQAQGEDQQVINTYVTAMVGSEASVTGTTLTDEQAAQNATTYIEVANATYC